DAVKQEKSEIRNSKSETNSNTKEEKRKRINTRFWTFELSDFGFVSDFEFRISDFEILPCIRKFLPAIWSAAKRYDCASGAIWTSRRRSMRGAPTMWSRTRSACAIIASRNRSTSSSG